MKNNFIYKKLTKYMQKSIYCIIITLYDTLRIKIQKM